MAITVLLVLAALIVIPLGIALFTKKEYFISCEILIQAPKEKVFDFLRILRNQDTYSKWVMTDPDMRKVFSGTDGQAGFVYAWESQMKQVGKGEQEIKQIFPGQRIDMEVRFEKPFKGISQTYFEVEALSAKETKVIWGFSSKMKYPMNLMMLLMNFEKMLGADIAESLQKLKTILEK